MFSSRILLTLPAVLAGACLATQPALAQPAAPAPTPGRVPAGTGASPAPRPAVFQKWRRGVQAVTYDTRVVPLGATARVEFSSTGQNLWIRLEVTGLVPRRAYGAHVHVAECGPDPKAAGPHFQHRHDPAATKAKPSADPAYANPANEIWLDFTTNARGAATVSREQHWMFPDDQPPKSLILHAQTTRTGPGVAGTAGDRVGCLNLPFGYGSGR
ncbi:superoxide dismutase family protein [Actinoplanes siamensis]|uniref:Superoxide dismutase copper/zinc binding domain-containing protein n=1 Tax=Actinoplanes siamensis TaxID=1223317 RepID=A0A919NAF0_9ACTN|nr:superoxide dismutase family protein [Actinoplanes siamensis]GIF07262.1 hypothetical protein Asi03nite_48000 [Actinoplanes siamensis]